MTFLEKEDLFMNKMVSQLLLGNDILSVQATLLRFDRGVDDHLRLVFEDNFETYEGVLDPRSATPSSTSSRASPRCLKCSRKIP